MTFTHKIYGSAVVSRAEGNKIRCYVLMTAHNVTPGERKNLKRPWPRVSWQRERVQPSRSATGEGDKKRTEELTLAFVGTVRRGWSPWLLVVSRATAVT